MPENSMCEHELEQMKVALAETLLDEIGLNVREALELADRFYEETATSPELGDSVDLANFGNFSLRDGFSCGNRYGSGRY